MLTLLLIIPIIGSLFILSIQENSFNSKSKMRTIAITTSLINFLISIFLWLNFDSNTTQFQFVSEFDYLTFGHLNFGVDGISLYFVLLTTFITPIAIISNAYNINYNLKFFLISSSLNPSAFNKWYLSDRCIPEIIRSFASSLVKR